MTRKPKFFRLGLFVVLAFGLTAAMLIAFGAGKFFKTEFLAETCFDESVQGLDIGSEVKYKGVKIGTVKAITSPARFYDAPSSYVLVIISLSEDCYVGQTGATAGDRLKKAVDKGLTITLSFKGITGAAYLETDYQGTRTTPLSITWTPENLYLPSRRSSIKRVGDALNQLLDTFTDINIKGMAQNLGSLVASLNKKVDALDTETLSNQAGNLLEELRQTNKKISSALNSDGFTRMMADAEESFSGLKTMIQGAGPPVDNTLKNFEQTAENLNQLTLELKKYPGRLLLERPPEQQTPEQIKEQLENGK